MILDKYPERCMVMATEPKKNSGDAASEAATTSQPTTEKSKEATIRYTGGASLRQITKTEWEQAGVSDQDTVAWSRSNNFTVKASLLNEAALNAIESDPSLVRE